MNVLKYKVLLAYHKTDVSTTENMAESAKVIEIACLFETVQYKTIFK